MADEADIAQGFIERERASALASIPKYEGESAEHCEECGEEIHPERRKAVPGCTRCTYCESLVAA